MCSIMGYCGPEPDMPAFTAGFDRTKSRGPDDSRVLRLGDGVLAFHRLAIMGLEPGGSLSSWTGTMSSATERSTALKR